MLYVLLTFRAADGRVTNTGYSLSASVESALVHTTQFVRDNLISVDTLPVDQGPGSVGRRCQGW